MRARVLALLALALVIVAGLGLGSWSVGRAASTPVKPWPLASITLSPRLYSSLVGRDGYYSFEAFRFIPPNVTPIVIKVATLAPFYNSSLTPYNSTVDIPPGNYSLILMQVSVNESGGPQYDRALYIYANGTPVFWGSTQEILNSTAYVDLTLFENLLQGPVKFQIVLPNWCVPKLKLTGHYNVNVTLYLYPGPRPAGLPNEFIPLFLNNFGYSRAFLTGSNDYAEYTVHIPNGTYRAWLLLYEEGGAYDEFWYTNIPAVRYIKVYYNGRLAGIVNPFETIYTGGIDLFWWKPVTSVNTLAFHTPDIIDLTPMLAYGLNATIAVHVADLLQSMEAMGVPGKDFQWTIAGVLMLWVNSSNPLISAQPLVQHVRYMDTGATIMTQSYMGYYFQEGASYSINYTSLLQFEHGSEWVTVAQRGVTDVYQAYNYAGTFAYNYLDEEFSETSVATGYEPYTLALSGNWPVTLYFDFVVIPITPPTTYPFNATYAQNGSITLTPSYSLSYAWQGYNESLQLSYDLYAVGGFSGIIEFISPTGAILISLTSNNALTTKALTATMLVNGMGFTENVYLEGLQNSTVNMAGYLIANQFSYQLINGGIPGAGDPAGSLGTSAQSASASLITRPNGKAQAVKGLDEIILLKARLLKLELRAL
ncbi:MAG: peptide-N4-asparagine amidase [Acidilobus sp.]